MFSEVSGIRFVAKKESPPPSISIAGPATPGRAAVLGERGSLVSDLAGLLSDPDPERKEVPPGVDAKWERFP